MSATVGKPAIRSPQLWIVYVLGILAASTIIARVFWNALYWRFDDKALYLFIIAGICVLLPYVLVHLPRVHKMKFGDMVELELGDLERSLTNIPAETREDVYDDLFTQAAPPSEVSSSEAPAAFNAAPPWTLRRNDLKRETRDVFLAHVLRPSAEPGQKYDIFVFLTRPGQSVVDDVIAAEFFFGRYWGNRVFPADVTSSRIGVVTAAYGPFLAICRIRFRDGYEVIIDRLIDFEMARVFA